MKNKTRDINYFVFNIFAIFFIFDIIGLLIQNYSITSQSTKLFQLFIIVICLVSPFVFWFFYPKKISIYYFLLCFAVFLFSKLFVLDTQTTELFYLFTIPVIISALFRRNVLLPLLLNIIIFSLLVLYFKVFFKEKFDFFVLLKFFVSFFVVVVISFFLKQIIYGHIVNNELIINDLKEKNFQLIEFQNKLNENIYELASKNIELNNNRKNLELNEYKFKRLLEDIGEGFLITDIRGNFLYANPAVSNIFEIEEEELLLKRINDFIDEQTQKLVHQQFKMVLKKAITSFELSLNVRNQKKKIIATLSPHYDFENNIIGILILIRDITRLSKYQEEIQQKNDELLAIQEELRQANEELTLKQEEMQRVNDKLYLIFENLPVGLVLFDSFKNKIQYANSTAFKIIKFDDILDLNLKKYFSFGSSINTNFAEEQEILDVNGDKIKILKSSTPITINNQELILQSFVDITELSKAQQTIILQKQLQETLINNIPDFVYIKDTELRYLLVNKALANDLNKTDQEIIGRNVSEFLTPELAEFYNKLDFQVLKSKQPIYNIEQKFISPQGKERWTLVSKLPLFDENNIIYAIIGISRDITEQKLKEEIIIEKNRQFENTIQNLEDIYFRTDFEGNLILTSKSIEKHFEYSIEEIKKINIFKDLIKTLNFSADNEIETEKLTNKSFNNISVKFKIKDEKLFYGIANINIWADKHGVPQGFEGIITNTTEITHLQKELISKNKILNISLEITRTQKEKLEELYNNLTDNINYARTIQFSLLPSTEILDKFFKEHFLFFEPRDIVSGDFYFVNQKEQNIYFAVGDCTGHSVTGAFLTILSISYLNQILYESNVSNTAGILNKLRSLIQQTFKDTGSFNNNGLDISICSYNIQTKTLQFSAANQNLFIANNGVIKVINGDRMPIGFYYENTPFNFFDYQVSENDIVYLLSDGFTDQFTCNETQRLKKFGTKRLKTLLANISQMPLSEQYDFIIKTFFEWKGSEVQIDDVTVLAIQF